MKFKIVLNYSESHSPVFLVGNMYSFWLSSEVNHVKHSQIYALWELWALNKPYPNRPSHPPWVPSDASTPSHVGMPSFPSGPSRSEHKGLCTVMNTSITFWERIKSYRWIKTLFKWFRCVPYVKRPWVRTLSFSNRLNSSSACTFCLGKKDQK